MNIPDEAVEAARKALEDTAVVDGPMEPVDVARRALGAAAPHIMAAALEDAADALGGAASWSNRPPSTAHIRRWLKSRAKSISSLHV